MSQILQKIYQSSSLVVWVTCTFMAIAMAFSFLGPLVGLVANMENYPFETLALAVTAVAGGYVGTDRVASFMKTQSLNYGEMDLGDVPKLRRMVFFLFFLVVEASALQVFFGVKNLPLNTLLLAYAGTTGAYVIGNKAVKAAAHTDGGHSTDQAADLNAPSAQKKESV